jgi:hypothetical protein
MSINLEDEEHYYWSGFEDGTSVLKDLVAERNALKVDNENLQAITNIPKNTLERFERLASRMVSEEYAQGYREACDHIMHEIMEKLGEKE